MSSLGKSFNSKFRSNGGRSDTANPLEILKELKELKDFNLNYHSNRKDTEGSRQSSVIISDLNDDGHSYGKTSNGTSTNGGKQRYEALSFMEKELKENEINLLEENLEVKKLMKQTNPDWYANQNNESTTSEVFQEAMLMYTKDFKNMKTEVKSKYAKNSKRSEEEKDDKENTDSNINAAKEILRRR